MFLRKSFKNLSSQDERIADERMSGNDALTYVGIPHEFAAQISIMCEKFGMTIAIRAGEADQQYDRSAMPKPSSLKWKSNDQFPAGVVTSIPELGRLNEKGEPVNLTYGEPPKHLFAVQHQPSFKSILRDLTRKPPRIEFVRADGQHIYLKRPANTPGKNPFLFRINMANASIPNKEIQARHKKFISTERKLSRSKSNTRIAEPESQDSPVIGEIKRQWQAAWGKFEDIVNNSYPLEFAPTQDDIIGPYEIYNINNPDQSAVINPSKKNEWHPFPIFATKYENQFSPITSDMDLLWISKPCKETRFITLCKEKDIDLHTPINTFLESNDEILHRQLTLMAELDPDEMVDMSEVSIARIHSLGNLSPWQAYIILAINRRFEEFVQHLAELLQHGPENENPGKLTNIDGMMIHFIDGQQIITKDTKDLIHFMLNRHEPVDLLSTYEIKIHPGWVQSNHAWDDVVQRLLSDHVFEVPEELEAQYTRKASLTRTPSAVFHKAVRRLSHSLSSTNLFSGSPPNRRKQSSSSGLESSADHVHYKHATHEELLSIHRKASKMHNPEYSLTSKANGKLIQELCQEQSADDWVWRTDDNRLITVYESLGTLDYSNESEPEPEPSPEAKPFLELKFEIQLNPEAISIHCSQGGPEPVELTQKMYDAIIAILSKLSPEEDINKDYKVIGESTIIDQYQLMQKKGQSHSPGGLK